MLIRGISLPESRSRVETKDLNLAQTALFSNQPPLLFHTQKPRRDEIDIFLPPPFTSDR